MGWKAKYCSFIYTNGNFIQYYKFPSKQTTHDKLIDEAFFRSAEYFNYGKEMPPVGASPATTAVTSSSISVLEMPVGIGITQFHYIILHSNSVSVLSQIT